MKCKRILFIGQKRWIYKSEYSTGKKLSDEGRRRVVQFILCLSHIFYLHPWHPVLRLVLLCPLLLTLVRVRLLGLEHGDLRLSLATRHLSTHSRSRHLLAVKLDPCWS